MTKSPYQLKRDKIEREAAEVIGKSMRTIMEQLALIEPSNDITPQEIVTSIWSSPTLSQKKWWSIIDTIKFEMGL